MHRSALVRLWLMWLAYSSQLWNHFCGETFHLLVVLGDIAANRVEQDRSAPASMTSRRPAIDVVDVPDTGTASTAPGIAP